MQEEIQKATEILNDGGIVIFPTDTAFGIGCRIDKEKAVERLLDIRKRPKNQPTSILVSSINMAEEYIEEIPVEVYELIKKYWPGALTIVLPCKEEKVPSLVRGGGSTIGVRMPNHKIALDIIKNVGVPILGPSANFHGFPTPYDFEDLDQNLVKLADYVVPGQVFLRQPSTVIDCSVRPWKILRKGAITLTIDK